MKCPSCGHHDTSVIDSRVTREGREIRRRRACESCKERFTTYERTEERTVYIVKKDKRREAFDREKLVLGLRKACEKLEVTSKQIQQAAISIARKIYDKNLEEVSSTVVGKYVMEALYDLDEVAYIRYSSVYLQFQDLSEFTKHIEKLRKRRKAEAADDKVSSTKK